MKNPFELNFGLEPDNYISRLKQSNEIVSSFEKTGKTNVYMITGMRGVGKTVLLSNISKYFEKKKDWIIVDIIPSKDMLDQLASNLYDQSLFHKIFDGKSFGFSFEGISFSIKGEKPITNVLVLLETLLTKIGKARKKVLICVDEISSNEFVRPFVQTFQLLLRKELPIYLLMTGLFENIYDLQNDKGLTFLYRAPKISLGPLNISSIASSYARLLHLDEAEALKCAKETKGYAYAYQVLGYLLFEENKKKMESTILTKMDQYLQEYVYEKVWSELSKNDKEVLKAFQNDTEKTCDLLEKTKMEKNVFSVYRDRLIKRGLCLASSYGELSLTLPRFSLFVHTAI